MTQIYIKSPEDSNEYVFNTVLSFLTIIFLIPIYVSLYSMKKKRLEKENEIQRSMEETNFDMADLAERLSESFQAD